MKLQSVALGSTRDPIDGIVFGPTKVYEIAQNEPFAFPPAGDFPHGGVFSFRVPPVSEGTVKIRALDGDLVTLDPGRYRACFLRPETHELVSTSGIAIELIANAEVRVTNE